MARNAIMTPTNVYPRNGAAVVFDENDQIALSFTNNSDALAYYKYTFYDCATNEVLLDIIFHNYNRTEGKGSVITHQRGDTVRLAFDRTNYGKTLEDGRHYKYKLTLYSCLPDETGEYLNEPNPCVPYASGRIVTVPVSDTEYTHYLQPGIKFLKEPEYWGDENLLIACSYIRIGNVERKILTYDSETGAFSIEGKFPDDIYGEDGSGTPHYQLYCNFISTNGSESEGSYDFYVRNEIESDTKIYPVPVGLRCNCTYSQANNVGLENYRFRVYATGAANYINGTVQGSDSEDIDWQNIPIETGITDELIGCTIIFATGDTTADIVSSGYAGTILNYDSTTGIVTLAKSLSKLIPSGRKYTIYKESRTLIADSKEVYSYHLCYNFPIYTFGQTFEIETALTNYEKQQLVLTDNLTFQMPEKDCPITEHKLYSNDSRHTLTLSFPSLAPVGGAAYIGWYNVYRRVSGEALWRFIGFMENEKSFTDYLAGNNHTYEYLIAHAVNSRDTADKTYIPANNYKPYEIDNVQTVWDGWTITAIKPYTDYDNYWNKYDIRTNEKSNRLSFVFAKEPFIALETWKFISDINSGDITSNLGLTVHVGTSAYPAVTRTSNSYQTGSFTADLLSISCPDNEIYDDIDKVNKWLRFINENKYFILKSAKGDVWIITITENTSRQYSEGYRPILTSVSYSWAEVYSPDDIEIVKE